MFPDMSRKARSEQPPGPLSRVSKEESWQQELGQSIRSAAVLCERLGLKTQVAEAIVDSPFPVLVPESFFRRMEYGNPHDPLLRQVLPVAAENETVDGFQSDPVGDLPARKEQGLLQKYQGRVLLVMNGTCAVHCRYCFRRDYPYTDGPKSLQDWEPAFAVIAADPTIREVIFSGGDPLMMSDARLSEFIRRIAEIEHVQRLRIHSRLPVVLPVRVTSTLLDHLTTTRLQPIFVVHANHPAELVGDCAIAVQRIVQSGIPVLNQAVLLRGVNDSVDVLARLCERCVDLGAIPYYLHQLDRVSGAAHFEVPQEQGLALVEQLRTRLPGYAVPRYVQELPGELSKTPLS